MSWVEALSVVVVSVILIGGFIWVAESWDARKRRPKRDSNKSGDDAWVITHDEVRKATPPASAHQDPPPPRPGPQYRISYRADLKSWAVYEWEEPFSRYYAYGIRYPSEGRWALRTCVPTWHDAINLITPNPATERGSSHKEEQ